MKCPEFMRRICCVIICLTLGGLVQQPARADVRVPHVFSSHMVLQRDRPLTIWGWADRGETVTVQLGDASSPKPAKRARGVEGESTGDGSPGATDPHCPLARIPFVLTM